MFNQKDLLKCNLCILLFLRKELTAQYVVTVTIEHTLAKARVGAGVLHTRNLCEKGCGPGKPLPGGPGQEEQANRTRGCPARQGTRGNLCKLVLNIGTASSQQTFTKTSKSKSQASDSNCDQAPASACAHTLSQDSKFNFLQKCCGFSSEQQSNLLGKVKKQESKKQPFQLLFK